MSINLVGDDPIELLEQVAAHLRSGPHTLTLASEVAGLLLRLLRFSPQDVTFREGVVFAKFRDHDRVVVDVRTSGTSPDHARLSKHFGDTLKTILVLSTDGRWVQLFTDSIEIGVMDPAPYRTYDLKAPGLETYGDLIDPFNWNGFHHDRIRKQALRHSASWLGLPLEEQYLGRIHWTELKLKFWAMRYPIPFDKRMTVYATDYEGDVYARLSVPNPGVSLGPDEFVPKDLVTNRKIFSGLFRINPELFNTGRMVWSQGAVVFKVLPLTGQNPS